MYKRMKAYSLRKSTYHKTNIMDEVKAQWPQIILLHLCKVNNIIIINKRMTCYQQHVHGSIDNI